MPNSFSGRIHSHPSNSKSSKKLKLRIIKFKRKNYSSQNLHGTLKLVVWVDAFFKDAFQLPAVQQSLAKGTRAQIRHSIGRGRGARTGNILQKHLTSFWKGHLLVKLLETWPFTLSRGVESQIWCRNATSEPSLRCHQVPHLDTSHCRKWAYLLSWILQHDCGNHTLPNL